MPICLIKRWHVLQIIGWVLIASILVCYLMLACLTRCYSPVSFHQLRFWQTYSQQERSLLESYSAEHAKNLANRNLKSFFDRTHPEEIVIPTSEDWQEISSFYRYQKDCYSTMQQYVEHSHDPDHADHAEHVSLASVRSGGPTVVL